VKHPLFAVLAIAAGGGAALTVSPVDIKEWPVPWDDTRPRDPYVDAQNRVWFVGQTGDYAAYLVPATGAFKRYDLEPGTGPHNLIVDARGAVWYAGNRAAHIGRLDPATGRIVKYPMPDPAARDPHTLIADSKGDIWFTGQLGNFVGKLAAATGAVRLLWVPTPQARPYGIVLDSRDRPWIALFGTNKLATVDSTGVVEIPLPRAGARPRRLEVGSDGGVWYVDYAGGYLGRYDPATRTVEEWPVPGGSGGRPYAMARDDQNRMWFVETGSQPNRLVGFDPGTHRFFSVTPIPSGGGTVRHMVYHAPAHSIWFGTDENTIGRALVPSSPP
jgi:virginiamycin B lyase